MPGCTLHVGPAQIRVGDIEMGGERRRVVDLLALGAVGKIVRFEDGKTRELRLGQRLLVFRPGR